MDLNKISIVIPAKNEAESLHSLLPSLLKNFSEAELIVVDDGSTDNTEELCKQHKVRCVRHLYSKGNGAAIKSGCRNAGRETIIFMDADGQHTDEYINDLIAEYEKGLDLVIGARDFSSHASFGRLLANTVYNKFASYMVNQKVPDLTSGFRIVNREKFMEFLHLYPNGFSYPTTSTMAFYRSGYSVGFIPITANKRVGKSHIRPFKDGVRFFLILFKVGTLFSPLKIFFPFSGLTFIVGMSYYIYTFLMWGRFTNMSAMLFISSILIFLIGLVSEQITMLLYQKNK
jgi:glycosyltransferase involved in cell wall biosynthesis